MSCVKQAVFKRCLISKLRLYSGVFDRSVLVHYTVQSKPCVSVVCTEGNQKFAFLVNSTRRPSTFMRLCLIPYYEFERTPT